MQQKKQSASPASFSISQAIRHSPNLATVPDTTPISDSPEVASLFTYSEQDGP